jgi:phage terminase large subunit
MGRKSMELAISNSEEYFNPVYLKNLTNQTPTQIYFGGSSSGKSFFILGQRTVIDVLTTDRNYLIVRNTAKTNRHSTFNEVLKGIRTLESQNGNIELFKVNKSEMTITAINNGNQILFSGLDDVEKLKSITPKKGVITDIVIEEGTEINYSAYKILTTRLRGRSRVKKRITWLFNPIYGGHWIFKDFFKGRWNDNKKELVEKDLYILKTTYEDNNFLEPDDIERLLREAGNDPYYRDVYVKGNWGVIGNLIFKNWEALDLSDYKFDRFENGLDFGFSNDPSAFVRVHINQEKKELYILDEMFATGLDNEELAGILKEKIKHEPIVCDSAEPKSIAELRKYRLNASGAKKGPGSLNTSYRFLQKFKIIIDEKCQNIINEFSTHKYKEDKDGNPLPVPEDKNNHGIDAIRYAIEKYILDYKVTSENIDLFGR